MTSSPRTTDANGRAEPCQAGGLTLVARGLTLVELMIALAVGSLLIVGALTLLEQSRTPLRVTESVARLQENARFAFDAVEPDIRMAGYFGLTPRGELIEGSAGPADPVVRAVTGDCGPNWAVDLASAIGAANNRYAWSCAPYGAAQGGADALVVRRVAAEPAALEENALHVQSARFGPGRLFAGREPPTDPSAAGAGTFRLVVNGYYVSPTSSLSVAGNPVPSLRVKTLIGATGGPAVVDREVLPGVEDLQIELGLDTDAPEDPHRGSIDVFVDPEDPLLAEAGVIVLAVRIWLRLRAEQTEAGFVDTSTYRYADREALPPGDGFRRLVVSRTIYLRNARPPA